MQGLTDSRVLEIMHRQSALETARATFESHWTEVAERCLPRQAEFNGQRTDGDKRSDKIFDSTAVLALDRAASAVDSLITPQTQMYHKLVPSDSSIAEDRQVKLYLDELNKQLFKIRYRSLANFASQAHECYVTQMAFGTMALFCDEIPGFGTRYKSVALSDMYISENAAGIVDLWHRKIRMTARAAIAKWGTGVLPEAIVKAADKEPFRKFEFLHVVCPNEEIEARAKNFRSMKLASFYISFEGKKILSEGGYHNTPYAVSRHVTAPNETYGRSPAMMVLADIKMLNEMEKTVIRAAHKVVSPPLLAYGDGILSNFSTRPDAINYGGVDEQGHQLVVPMKMGSNLPIALEMTEQKRKVINDAFYVTLFQILVQNPQMTATEALIRAQEKGQLLAPTVGRTQSEFLGPIVVRDIQALDIAGMLPEMPRKLRDRGGVIKIEHTSPLSRLRRAEDAVAIMRTIEGIAPMANIDPTVMDRFDPDIILEELADINGVPERVLRPLEVVRQMREERKQAAMAKQVLEGAETASNSARNLAGAADKMGMAPDIGGLV